MSRALAETVSDDLETPTPPAPDPAGPTRSIDARQRVVVAVLAAVAVTVIGLAAWFGRAGTEAEPVGPTAPTAEIGVAPDCSGTVPC